MTVIRQDSQQHLSLWLTLSKAPQLGSASARTLLECFPSIGDLFDSLRKDRSALPGNLPDETLKYLRKPAMEDLTGDLAWLEQHDQNAIVTLDSPDYPNLLREASGAPLLLYCKGDRTLLHRPQLAIVGSRNPSSGGRETAFQFAKALSLQGVTITSGMALGIDAAAHQGALDGTGATIAVVGTGLDRIYPKRNETLARDICHKGLMISEFAIGTPALPTNFPRRNRIISGLSLGTLVVEAALHSGSLITARLAAEQGREVFAIPGSIHNPLSKGCHTLIRQGAKLVETMEHVLEELPGLSRSPIDSFPVRGTSTTQAPLDNQHQNLLEHMGFDPISLDTLVERSGLTTQTVCSMLLVLELHNTIKSHSGLYTRLV